MAPTADPEDTKMLDSVQPARDSANGTSDPDVSSVAAREDGAAAQSASVAQPPTDPRPTTSTHADLTSTADQRAQSQSTTTPKSASPSNATSKDAKEPKDSAMASAAPTYGTRSRGSRAVPRPNYAEDAEPMDFEYTQSAANGTAHAPSQKSSEPPTSRGPSPPPPRKVTAATNNGWASVNTAAPKEKEVVIPGTSTFSANVGAAPAPAPTKRRKAHTTTNGAHTTSSQATSRRTAHQSAVVHAARESNMMTFEKCKAMLKDGKLEADDGTVISVNGACFLAKAAFETRR